MTAELKTATFAGGCFWCMVQPFDTYPGIERVVSGYTGGHVANPTYEQVCAGGTGHTEAVQITYDPSKVSYADLVEIYWQQTDPTDAFGQFQDRGDNYRPVEDHPQPKAGPKDDRADQGQHGVGVQEGLVASGGGVNRPEDRQGANAIQETGGRHRFP